MLLLVKVTIDRCSHTQGVTLVSNITIQVATGGRKSVTVSTRAPANMDPNANLITNVPNFGMVHITAGKLPALWQMQWNIRLVMVVVIGRKSQRKHSHLFKIMPY